MYTLRSTLHTLYSILYTLYSTLYTLHTTLNTRCSMLDAQYFILYSILYTRLAPDRSRHSELPMPLKPCSRSSPASPLLCPLLIRRTWRRTVFRRSSAEISQASDVCRGDLYCILYTSHFPLSTVPVSAFHFPLAYIILHTLYFYTIILDTFHFLIYKRSARPPLARALIK